MNFASHEWKGEWMSLNTHPSPLGAKYKKTQLEQERANEGQEDRSPMGTKKKLRANISKEETKAQLEPRRKLNFSNKKMLQKPHSGQVQHTSAYIHESNSHSGSLNTCCLLSIHVHHRVFLDAMLE